MIFKSKVHFLSICIFNDKRKKVKNNYNKNMQRKEDSNMFSYEFMAE